MLYQTGVSGDQASEQLALSSTRLSQVYGDILISLIRQLPPAVFDNEQVRRSAAKMIVSAARRHTPAGAQTRPVINLRDVIEQMDDILRPRTPDPIMLLKPGSRAAKAYPLLLDHTHSNGDIYRELGIGSQDLSRLQSTIIGQLVDAAPEILRGYVQPPEEGKAQPTTRVWSYSERREVIILAHQLLAKKHIDPDTVITAPQQAVVYRLLADQSLSTEEINTRLGPRSPWYLDMCAKRIIDQLARLRRDTLDVDELRVTASQVLHEKGIVAPTRTVPRETLQHMAQILTSHHVDPVKALRKWPTLQPVCALLLDTTMTRQDICDKLGIPLRHLSAINGRLNKTLAKAVPHVLLGYVIPEAN